MWKCMDLSVNYVMAVTLDVLRAQSQTCCIVIWFWEEVGEYDNLVRCAGGQILVLLLIVFRYIGSRIACQNLSEEFWFKGQITHYKSDQASWTLMYICQYPAAAPEPAAATHPTRRNCFMSPFIALGFKVCGRSDLQHSGLRRRATKLKSGAA
jgi:hypothetical protein